MATISAESTRETSIRHGHPSMLHLWWARRPLAAAYADGHDDTRWVGLTVASHVSARPGGYLVTPEAAEAQIEAERVADNPDGETGNVQSDGDSEEGHRVAKVTAAGYVGGTATVDTRFYGQFPLDSVRAIR